mgnify:CR=1 FL=1|tara:strand:+ start:53001 stop:54044 length:1044 start_codon:yes stop_codon:yes gene_type:complete
MNIIKFKNLNVLSIALAFCLLVPNVQANEFGISDMEYQQIESRVNKMNFSELNDRRALLLREQAAYQSSGGSGSSSARARLAELSAIQKALIAIAGLGAISALADDDKKKDTVAPVITVNGDNPATVELGTSYTDAGASVTDDNDPSPALTSSGTVDTNTVGSYTITYSASDLSGNSSTASRTVNVTDTTAPVFTSSSTFVVSENVTAIGTVTATDADTVTFTISDTTVMAITTGGVLTFTTAINYEDKPGMFEYDGSTYDFTATVTATDASSNATTQSITVSVQDVGGIDDDEGTGTGTGTGTESTTEENSQNIVDGSTIVPSTDTGTGTGSGTGTGTDSTTETSS